jgi:hypothetical protein
MRPPRKHDGRDASRCRDFCRHFPEQKVAKEKFSRYFVRASFHRAQAKQLSTGNQSV